MIYRKLGKSDLNISAVGIGTWAMGDDTFGHIDEPKAIAAIDAAIDSGVNLIDTAPAYGAGHAESLLGRALAGGKRQKIILATKCGIKRIDGGYVKCLDPAFLREDLENSLRRLGTDYIDLYQIHWPWDGLEDAFDALCKMRDEGKVRYLGVSNFSPAQMQLAIEQAGIVSAQPPLSLLEEDSLKEVIPFCREQELGVLSYGSLGGGILTGRFSKNSPLPADDNRGGFYPYYSEPMFSRCLQLVEVLKEIAAERGVSTAQVAINWAILQPGVTTALVGATKPEHAASNAAAAEFTLTEAELARIDAARAHFIG